MSVVDLGFFRSRAMCSHELVSCDANSNESIDIDKDKLRCTEAI